MSSMFLPESRNSITAGGRTLQLTAHADKQKEERRITKAQIEHVLNNWILRGVHTEADGRQSIVHFAYVPAHAKLIRVAVSMDGERITTVLPDRTATRNWSNMNLDYFDRYQNLEDRDASEL